MTPLDMFITEEQKGAIILYNFRWFALMMIGDNYTSFVMSNLHEAHSNP